MLVNPNHISFFKHVKRECRRYKIKLVLSQSDAFIDDGQSYGGYFDHVSKELGVTHFNTEYLFIPILVHEFSHMEQWIDKDPCYTKHLIGGYESSTIMSEWLNGREYDYKTVKKAIDILRDCELDCERRVIKNIEKYKLDINVKKYCKEANAYILFYNYIIRKRRWEYKESPSSIIEILDEMPDNLFSLNYTKLLPEHRKLFDNHLK